jgi:hypothetical protein
LLPPGAIFSSDWVDFMLESEPLDSLASFRFIGVAADGAARSDEGALCWVAVPADGASRPIPCALARPVPAISAAAATDIKKRLVMEYLLVFALPARQRKEMRDVPRYLRFQRVCLVNMR